MEQEFDANAAHKLAMNAATKSGITTLLRDADLEKRERFSFSIDLEAGKVTNQKQSGRCWMFAALNTMRVEVMKKLNLENMELSQNYTLFYDKLEKANYFLESILDTVDEPTDGRLISWLLMAPLNDGGQWDMLANIIRKYGIVPKEAMPETFSSSCTREITPWMTKKLREFACTLRTAYAKGASMEELQEKKQEMMSVIYRMLVIALGKPPKTFTSDRYITMPQRVIDLIQAQGYVTNYHPDHLSYRFQTILRDNDIPPFRFHDLRHFCCSYLHSMNVPDIYIMQRSGHSTSSTLRQIYTHTLQDQSQKETERILNGFKEIEG